MKSDFGITFSKNLRRELRVRGLSVAELAKRSGVPAKTIYGWTSGQRPRNVEQVKMVADVLEITLDELLFATPKALECSRLEYSVHSARLLADHLLAMSRLASMLYVIGIEPISAEELKTRLKT